MSKAKGLRNGFTLVEVLVILAILAILAGVLVPSIANQVNKADPNRASSDLTAIRTAMEAFTVDVKRYPGDMDDLVEGIADDSSDFDINLAKYPTGLTGRWAGPYFGSPDSVIVTAYSGSIEDDFTTVTTNGSSWVTVLVSGIAYNDFTRIDELMDGAVDSADGRLRWDPVTTKTKYLAVPIN